MPTNPRPRPRSVAGKRAVPTIGLPGTISQLTPTLQVTLDGSATPVTAIAPGYIVPAINDRVQCTRIGSQLYITWASSDGSGGGTPPSPPALDTTWQQFTLNITEDGSYSTVDFASGNPDFDASRTGAYMYTVTYDHRGTSLASGEVVTFDCVLDSGDMFVGPVAAGQVVSPSGSTFSPVATSSVFVPVASSGAPTFTVTTLGNGTDTAVLIVDILWLHE